MFNDTSTSALYSLSLHDALPICLGRRTVKAAWPEVGQVIAVRDIERGSSATEMLDAPASAYDGVYVLDRRGQRDRKSTRLNSSHVAISYAVFCLKNKMKR